ncbi:MAG: GAF domain-containing protein [Deltaproteobacteria bacterium]|nr:GAF domain-containing protein [Deltaproteobacteria bacterium]
MMDVERHARRLQALAESGQLFAEASTGLDRLLGVVARRFSELVGEAVNIRLIEGDDLVPVATYHPDPEIDAYLRDFHDATPLRVGEGISGQVLATGEPYFEPALDLARLKQRIAPRFVPIFERIGITGMIVARLRARGINLGYLSLFRTSPERPPYTHEDLSLVQDLAERAALAIDNSRILDGLERRVAERTQALETANRELEAFAYSVSHDLRSPLRSIEGFSNLLEEDHGAQLDPDARRMLAVVRKNAQHMSQLVEGLLRLSRLGHRAIQPVTEVDMREIIEAEVAGIRIARPAVPIELRLGEVPRALGNADLLRQVWINLLDNAVKYSSKRGVAIVEVVGLREGGELHYTVTDHGAGFDPGDADRLFGVFERLHHHAEFEGTGVGLALVHRIVTRHGGHVWAGGRPDAGATFGFGLPERGPNQR